MSRIAYVNGRYVPHGQAKVAVEDRGYQFADGVYEVCEVRGGRMIDETRHMARLDRSLKELRIARPMSPRALAGVMRLDALTSDERLLVGVVAEHSWGLVSVIALNDAAVRALGGYAPVSVLPVRLLPATENDLAP